MPTSVAYIGTGQIMGWGNKAIEIRSVETGHLDGVFMHKKAQRLKFLCERNDKVVLLHLYSFPYKNIISHCLWILYCHRHNQYCIYSYFVAEQPNSGLDRLIVEVSRSCTVRHRPAKNPLNEWWARCYLHNKHKRQTFMLSVGFEPVVPAIEQLQTYTVEHNHQDQHQYYVICDSEIIIKPAINK